MTEQMAKIRLKLGQIEVEFEGESTFLQDGLVNLLGEIADFYKKNGSAIPTANLISSDEKPGRDSANGNLDYSTNTIATHLDVKKGPDLAIASAAHLSLVKGMDKFLRKDILEQMQSASTFYNANYSANLTKILNGLVKSKRLNLVAKDTFALSASERKSLEDKLA